MALLEIACFSTDNAITACNAGADRIELCDDREAGGTTPSADSIRIVKQHVTVPVFVMIRPRGGNFAYTEQEFEQMKTDIDRFNAEVDGFVFGILDDEHRVNITRTTELVQMAHPLPCTFHRAFDETRDKFRALEDVIASGCQALLTSGGASNAVTGAHVLSDLVVAAQARITIIPGGGVRSRNINILIAVTGAIFFHSSALTNRNTKVQFDEIRRMKQLLDP